MKINISYTSEEQREAGVIESFIKGLLPSAEVHKTNRRDFYSINRPCYPSVWEVMQAKKIFSQYIQQHAHEVQATPGSVNYTSPEVIISCALAQVWEAGRLYQQKLNT